MTTVRRSSSRLGAPLAVLTAFGLGLPAHAETYELRPLGYVVGDALDDDGRVAAHDNGNGDAAILEGINLPWQLIDARVRDLDEFGRATGVLDGQTAFLFDGITTLPLPVLGANASGSSWIELRALADGGSAVGTSTVSPNPAGVLVDAIEWDGLAAPTRLTVPNRVQTYAEDVSASGDWVVGRSYDGLFLDGQAILWDSARIPQSLSRSVTLTDGTPYVGDAAAYGVNDDGDVVGHIGSHPVVWHAGSLVPEHLGMPFTGTNDCKATAINETGVIVGDCGNSYQAFVWRPGDTQLTALDDELDPAVPAGWALRTGLDINASGQITGYGMNPIGQVEGFMLSPHEACLRRCTFSDGSVLDLPSHQCGELGGTQGRWDVATVCHEPMPVDVVFIPQGL